MAAFLAVAVSVQAEPATPNAAAGFTLPAQVGTGGVALKLSPQAHGPNVLLGDLVDGPLAPAIAVQSVKPTGRPGSTVTVDSALIALKLKRAGLSLKMDGPKSLTVQVGKQQVPGEALRKFAFDFLSQRLSATAGAEITPTGKVYDLELYDAPIRFRVLAPEGTLWRGNLNLPVDVLQETFGGQERVAATVPVSFLIKRQETRLFTTKVIRRGDPLDATDLEARAVDATFVKDGVADLAAVQGLVARVFVPAGKVLTDDMVERPAVIRRGDIVRLLVRSGSVVVETSAKALRDAKVGESIPLQVQGGEDGNKQVQARCVEAGVVVRDAP